MKIAYLFVTTEQDEFYAVQCFRDAYARYNGAEFTGTMTVFEHVSDDDITQSYLQTLIDDGYEMIIRNTHTSSDAFTAYKYARTQGLLAVLPTGNINSQGGYSGGNNYRNYAEICDNNKVVIWCGSGVRGVGNATGYPCFFYDGADLEQLHPITAMSQNGSNVDVTISGGDFLYHFFGMTITDVTGFSNNPNGVHEIINPVFDYFSCKFAFDLGSGTYAGGGFLTVKTQSYSTPTVAGLFAFLKDTYPDLNWNQITSMCIQAGSNYPNFDTYSGLGYIDIARAMAIFNTRTLTAPVLSLVTDSTPIFDVAWSIVANAEKYEVYFRGEYVTEYPAHITKHRFTLSQRYSKNKKNYVKIKAINGDDYIYSNLLELSHYGYPKVLVA